ncbi:salivary glue protein Sgs-3 isoform X1 [Zeugodacus cucurbitae]|uniref:salivary glue protein Sgs-3 isoform X1 n=1 Tax=Zeugodacus cucurbitae TaxID=28588 RepID=UPI0023D91877|nr:salivary glue protein Sgs-3 isoform X1 [Zeugodacus cucurbitae]
MKFATTFALLAALLIGASEAFVLRDEPVVIISHDGKITKIPVNQLPECYHKLQTQLEEYVTKEQVTTEQMTQCFATIVDISECFDKYNSILNNITQRITVVSQKIDVCLLDAIQPAAVATPSTTPHFSVKTTRRPTTTTPHFSVKTTRRPTTTTPHFSVKTTKTTTPRS